MDPIFIQSQQKVYFKHLHSSIRTMKIDTYIATALFNEGYAVILKIIDGPEIKIMPQYKQ